MKPLMENWKKYLKETDGAGPVSSDEEDALHKAVADIVDDPVSGESPAEIRNITDLKNLFNARSQGATDSYGSVRATAAVEFTKTEVDDALRELERAIGWLRMYRLADDTPVKELKET